MSAVESNEAVLDLAGVDLSYRLPDGATVHVLQGVDLAVGPGEMVCVAGRSGSGKSSLLYVAAGLLTPDTGSVSWLGQPITGLKNSEITARRQGTIGFVFQSGGLVDLLTAAENVSLSGLASTGVSASRSGVRARATSLLEQVELGDRSRHFPAELSGGERQRVALARALFNDPPLLIVDEPTASLDAAAAQHIVDLLKRLRSGGRSVLVASHDQHVIDGADRVVRLE